MATPNTLFAVLNVGDPALIQAKLNNCHWPYLKLEDGQWLLVAPNATTTKEVSDYLGFDTSSTAINGIVLRVDGYYGRNLPSVWDWISTKQGADLGAART